MELEAESRGCGSPTPPEPFSIWELPWPVCPLCTSVARYSRSTPTLLLAMGDFRELLVILFMFLSALFISHLLSTCCVYGLSCSPFLGQISIFLKYFSM